MAFERTDGCFRTLAGTGSESSHLSGAPGSSDVWLDPAFASNALWLLVRLQPGADTSRLPSINQ